MGTLHFAWDEAKAKANVKKHGVSFEEERFVLLGYSSSLKLLVVCHCYRTEGRTIRLISARKATRTEASVYER